MARGARRRVSAAGSMQRISVTSGVQNNSSATDTTVAEKVKETEEGENTKFDGLFQNSNSCPLVL